MNNQHTDSLANNGDASQNKPLLVIGLGHTGISALLALDKNAIYPNIDYIAIDSDINDLTAAHNAGFRTMQLGEEALHGAGTGGDWEMGGHLFEDSSDELQKISSNRRLVIVIAALGGGIGGAIEAMLATISEEDVQILVIGVMPFHFESNERKAHADFVLPQLSLLCQAIAIAPNDIIISKQGDCTPAEAFSAASRFLVNAAIDFTAPLASRNLLNVNPEIISSICIDSNPQCYLIQAEGSVQSISTAISHHPLLQIPKFIKNMDKAIVLMRVNKQCTETMLDTTLTMLSKILPPGIMDTAACEDENLQVPMRVTIMLHFKGIFHQSSDENEKSSTSPQKRPKKDGNNGQIEFSFDVKEKLGIFSEDIQPPNQQDCLDLPTFIRLGIQIHKGELH